VTTVVEVCGLRGGKLDETTGGVIGVVASAASDVFFLLEVRVVRGAEGAVPEATAFALVEPILVLVAPTSVPLVAISSFVACTVERGRRLQSGKN
jgi:hypothetical protein